MNIAILGATSQIAQDLLRQWALANSDHSLTLYSRRPEHVVEFMKEIDWACSYSSCDIIDFTHEDKHFDAIINFIGQGKPISIVENSSEIMKVTELYDNMVMKYLSLHQNSKYLFLSSGAVYGSVFSEPVTEQSMAQIPINRLGDNNAYAIAKLYAEANHRLNKDKKIVDIRVFNVFSRYQSLNTGFFITDIVSAIKNKSVLTVSPSHMVRDYLHPEDFFQLIEALLNYEEHINTAVDCFSKMPIDKFELLKFCEHKYGLKWSEEKEKDIINATGSKNNYYSKNKLATKFGFEPRYSSLESVQLEIDALIGSYNI
ncbi:hypothetical protein JT31_20495 [Cedecea neteri]|uniref:NAD-dependent epimerase/dehydratase domain-containing protein n=2 Tax=Enterobacteriaceae TaxID=543 RepID=A0A089RKF6_9ENTR|nr:hypothetical protein JT31_20495 [Cedecea neteri]